jgi:ubiquitin
MKYFLILLYPILLMGMKGNAQKEFKKSLSGITRIEIETETNIRIIKGTGNEIKVTSGCTDCGDDRPAYRHDERSQKEEEDKSKGLKAIYPGGTDNTGMGMIQSQDGGVLKLKDLMSFLKREGLTITLPSTVALYLDAGPLGHITIDEWTSELELKTNTGQIKLKKVTGPVTAHSATGNIEADFSSLNQDAPVSLISSTGDIEVTLPSSVKASVEMKSVTGGVYSNFELIKPREDGLKPISGHKAIAGNINNGGVKVSLKASTGNIYLRKK